MRRVPTRRAPLIAGSAKAKKNPSCSSVVQGTGPERREKNTTTPATDRNSATPVKVRIVVGSHSEANRVIVGFVAISTV